MRIRVAMIVAVVLSASPALAQPKIEIEGGTKFDFGEVYRGNKVERKLVVKNTGNQTLEISRVDAACGCTGTVLSNSSILPGKTGEVLVSFNSQNFSGKTRKTVTIHSNAPTSPTVVEFEANVVQEITVNPQQFWFRDAEVGRTAKATIALTNNSKEPVTLTGYTCTVQGFSLTLPKAPIPPGKSVELTAELKATAPMQVLSDGVSIKTSSKTEPDVFVRIFGSVKEFKFQ
jgi:hypothetical protein